jgi:hypothetical protein
MIAIAAREQTFRRTFVVGDRALRVQTDDPIVDAYLGRAWARLASPVDAEISVTVPLDEGAIFWRSGNAEIWFDGHRLTLDRTLETPLEAAVRGAATLIGKTMRRLQRRRALYAAGLATGNACVAIAGPSGTGKTTLALELLRRGWATYGDEFVLLDRATLEVAGVPLAFMVREPALERLDDRDLARRVRAGTFVSDADGVRTWHDLDVEEAFGSAAIAKPHRLTHLVVLARSENGISSLETLSPANAALELLPHLFSECLRVADVWETVELFEQAACYRLCAADHRSAAGMLDAMVASCR